MADDTNEYLQYTTSNSYCVTSDMHTDYIPSQERIEGIWAGLG